MSGRIRRVLNGVGANAFGQLVTVFVQLASLPVYMSVWSGDQYGKWLILAAVPIYISMADAGFIGVAINKMTMDYASGDIESANLVFSSSLVFVAALSLLLFVLSVIVIFFLGIEYFSEGDNAWVLMFLLVSSFISLYVNFFDAIPRASGNYALGVYLVNFVRLIEWCGGVASFFMVSDSFYSVALGGMLVKLFFVLIINAYLIKRFRDFRWTFFNFSFSIIRDMLPKAFAYLCFPVGNALNLQGAVFVGGYFFGPLFVAQFSTFRTISRVVIQMMTMVNRSLWPEITRAWAIGDKFLVKKIYNKGSYLSLAASVGVVLVVFAFSDFILSKWTGGKIPNNELMLGLLLIATAISGAGQLGVVVLLATNNHSRIAVLYLIFSFVSLIVSLVFCNVIGWVALPVSIILFDIANYVFSRASVSNMLRDENYAA